MAETEIELEDENNEDDIESTLK
jgi:hypothetical protein